MFDHKDDLRHLLIRRVQRGAGIGICVAVLTSSGFLISSASSIGAWALVLALPLGLAFGTIAGLARTGSLRNTDFWCRSCGKHVPHDTKWKCGRCRTTNDGFGSIWAFCRCQRCRCYAPGYQCHHHEGETPCQAINWFTNAEVERDKRFVARAYLEPKPTEAPDDEHVRNLKERDRKIELATKDLKFEETASKLAALQRGKEYKPPPKSEAEQRRELHHRLMEGVITLTQAKQEVRKMAEAACPNDPAAADKLFEEYEKEVRRMRV